MPEGANVADALQRGRPRKIVFATAAGLLVPMARRTYGLPELAAHWLPNPIEIPDAEKIKLSARPSLL